MFAVRADGGYLRVARTSTGGGRRRKFVSDLDKATHWTQSGHAVNAVREAMTAKVIPATAIVEIVPVVVTVKPGPARRVKRRRGKFGRVTFTTV
jgi:hypothetical protein